MVLGIYGTGGSGRELEEMIVLHPELSDKWSELVFIDDTKEAGLLRDHKMMPFDSFVKEYNPENAQVTIAVGEPEGRRFLHERVVSNGYTLATVVSPKANISKYATLGNGVVVKDNTLVSCEAVVSDNVYIQENAIIGHDVHVNENCQISVSVFIGGRSVIEKNSYLGASSSIREDTTIGEGSIVSMGAVVLKDVRPGKIAMGNPAREIAENKDHKVFR